MIDRLIGELGARHSVYETAERSEMLLHEENRMISIAEEQKLNSGKIELIRKIFSRVNPALFD